ELRGDAKILITLLKGGPSTTAELQASIEKNNLDWAPDRITRTLERLVSFSLVENADIQAGVQETPKRKRRDKQIMLTYPLLKPGHLRWLTQPLSHLLSPGIMLYGIPALLLLHLLAWIKVLHPLVGSASALAATVHTLRPSLFMALAFGNYLGLLFHELGHASACVRCNTKHGPIGVCLYWVLPGLYTDVTQAWRLPAKQRLIVDAGGIFFSLIAATVALAGFLISRYPVCALLCSIFQVTVLINLIPFLRMDGYWMISDGLGIPNMMQANKELSQWAVLRVLRLTAAPPRIFSLPASRRRIYYAYYFGFVAFTLYFLWTITVWYVPQLGHLAGGAITGLYSSFRNHLITDAAKNGAKLVVVFLPALGLALYYGRAIRRSFVWLVGVLNGGRA
ncbi:MAG TPA: hypothetical protein VIK39_02615, partial [Candidatus Angelobacter sp.]